MNSKGLGDGFTLLEMLTALTVAAGTPLSTSDFPRREQIRERVDHYADWS